MRQRIAEWAHVKVARWLARRGWLTYGPQTRESMRRTFTVAAARLRKLQGGGRSAVSNPEKQTRRIISKITRELAGGTTWDVPGDSGGRSILREIFQRPADPFMRMRGFRP